MLFTDDRFADNFAKDPSVVKFRGEYFLYHSVPPWKDIEGWSVAVARSKDLENWEQAARIPLTQECEKNGIAAPGAIVLNDAVHIFYQTYGNGANDAICHAVSHDGVNFIKDESNPVYKPEATWCCGRAIDADVCVFGGKLLMYFATRDHAMKVQKIGCAEAELDSDFSRGSWHTSAARSLIIPEFRWEGECTEAPACIVNDGRIYLFYGGSYNCTPQQIGCAISKDGLYFEKISDKPFLTNGEKGSWNQDESGHPCAFADGSDAYLFYQGTNDKGKTWYITKKKLEFIDGVPRTAE
jgi:predicted GH43/DUF377 family glycosyl hydrolase